MEPNSEAERTGVTENADRVDLLVEELCSEARAACGGSTDEWSPFRSESIYRAVMEAVREQEERKRRSWVAKLIRFANRLATPVSTLWHPRAARSLVR